MARKPASVPPPPPSEATAAATSTALASRAAPLIPLTSDELEGYDVSFDVDGLDEASAEDFRVAAKIFNFKGLDPKTGRQIPIDVFFDTIDETTKEQLDAVLLHLHKTNLYSTYNESTKKSDVYCRSFDQVTGTMFDGTTRPCEGCPDAVWRAIPGKDGKLKRTRPCGPVYNVMAMDRETQMPFVIRFRRTSLPVIKSHLQRHHLGRRIVNGKRANYPLFSFRVLIKLKVVPEATHAIPVIERMEVLTREEIMLHANSAQYLHDNMFPILNRAEEQSVAAEGDAEVVDTGDYSSQHGKDFVDAANDQGASA
jgi:hypothetical protein